MTAFATDPKGEGLTVAIVWSRFNEDIVRELLTACDRELVNLGVAPADIDVASVPGALEIPLALQALALRTRGFGRRYDALVALGAVIRGETYHFEVVSNESARALMALSLDGIPIGNGILTVENEAQALTRARRTEKDKGGEAAKAAIRMLELREKFAG